MKICLTISHVLYLEFDISILNHYLINNKVKMDDSHTEVKTRAFKVIIVGPQAVGKSSILYRLS